MATGQLPQTRTSVDWVGSLATIPLAEVLKRVAMEEKSGDLQVNLGSAIKSIYFDHGFVVFAASNLKRDRLGESLIQAGRISRHEFALASMLMKGSRRKFGQALVQAGVMSEEELGRQVANQVNRIVLSLFKANDGIYSFDERGSGIPVELMVSLSIYRIMLEGIRHMTDGKLILAGLPPLNTMVRVSEQPPFTIHLRKLKSIEQTILKAAGKGAPLASLMQLSGVDRGHALRACYGLYAAGLLEQAAMGRPRRPLKVQEETGAFMLSEIQGKFAKIRATNAQQEILMAFDRLDRVGDRELLELDGPWDKATLDAAYTAARDAWDKKRELVGPEGSLAHKVDEIQSRLDSAYRRLLIAHEKEEGITEPSGGSDFASSSAELATGKPLDGPVLETSTEETLPPLNDEYIEELGIETKDIERPAPSGPNDTQPTESRRETLASASPVMFPTPETEDAERAERDRRPDEVTESERAEEAEAADSKLPESPPLVGAARQERIRQLLRDVKLHFQVRDWEHAVSLLYELVDLSPNEPSHHAMLARAMARHPVMRKDAERHFIEALRLAPQDADLHYSLGLYYRSFGMHSRAENEFRTALRINPRHEGARKHLGGTTRKDPLRDMFKKIFG